MTYIKNKIVIGNILAGFFLMFILITEGVFLHRAIGPGALFIGNLTIFMFILCSIVLFMIIAIKIKEII